MRFRQVNLGAACSALLCGGVMGSASAQVVVTVSTNMEVHTVTKMEMGSNLEYTREADSIYADGQMAHILKDVGVGTVRWPGGTIVTRCHWDALTGNWYDSWNPSYSRTNELPAEYMDLDEYLELIDRTGAEIMLGVNMSSGKEWNREADGVNEARGLVQACKDRGYDVKYVYFDNESYHSGNGYNMDVDGDGEAWTPEIYANSFNLYAAAVKEVFPNAKLIANWKNNVTTAAFKSNMVSMLSIAGTNIDYVDVHFYWEWNTASWELWKSQKPMLSSATTKTYTESVIAANNAFVSIGYPNTKLAVMEWNIGPGPWQTDAGHNGFKTALMQAEMQMQLLQSGLDIGLFYAVQSPTLLTNEDKHITHDKRPNATALWMWLFSKTIGKTVVSSSSATNGIYILAAKGEHGELVTYLLNKTDQDQTVEFNIPGYTVTDVSEAWRFKNDGAGAGVFQKMSIWEVGGKKRTTLKADTINMIGFNYPVADSDADGIPDAWEVSVFGTLTNASSTSDADSDGYTDYCEYMAGTDPHDAQSRLEIQSTELDGLPVSISWVEQMGRNYQLFSCTNLLAGVWQQVSGSLIGISGSNSAAVSASTLPVYYKLQVSP